jgi:hypothetical protein
MSISVDRAAEAARVAVKMLSDLEEISELHAYLAAHQARTEKRRDTKDVAKSKSPLSFIGSESSELTGGTVRSGTPCRGR